MAQIGHRNWNFLEQLWFGRGKLAGSHRVGEPGTGVGAVAEGLIGGLTAAAEGDHRTSGKAEGGTGGVQNFEVAFDPNRSAVENCYLGWHYRDGSTGVLNRGPGPAARGWASGLS
jgi:hypothetical protein